MAKLLHAMADIFWVWVEQTILTRDSQQNQTKQINNYYTEENESGAYVTRDFVDVDFFPYIFEPHHV